MAAFVLICPAVMDQIKIKKNYTHGTSQRLSGLNNISRLLYLFFDLFILFSLLLFFLFFPHPLDLSLPSFPLFSQPISLFFSQRETRVLFSEAREKLRLTYESHREEISNFRQFFSLLFSLLFFMVSN